MGGMVSSCFMKKGTCHHDKLRALKRIEGQVRGVRKMIEGERYCVEILNVLEAIRGALKRIESSILKDHVDACVRAAFRGKSRKERDTKLEEIFDLIDRLRK